MDNSLLPPDFIIHDSEIIINRDEDLGSGAAGAVQKVKLIGKFGGIDAAMKVILVEDQMQVKQAKSEVDIYMCVSLIVLLFERPTFFFN